MATIKATLTSTPVKISTGSKAVHVTRNKGPLFVYAISATMPTDLTSFHTCREPTMNIGEGFTVWVWNPSGHAVEIAYSEAT